MATAGDAVRPSDCDRGEPRKRANKLKVARRILFIAQRGPTSDANCITTTTPTKITKQNRGIGGRRERGRQGGGSVCGGGRGDGSSPQSKANNLFHRDITINRHRPGRWLKVSEHMILQLREAAMSGRGWGWRVGRSSPCQETGGEVGRGRMQKAQENEREGERDGERERET